MLLAAFENGLQNGVRLPQHVVVPEANNVPAECIQSRGSVAIALAAVLAAIRLDNQPNLYASEVGNIRPNRHLPPKLEATQIAVAQMSPQFPLGIGGPAP